MNATIELIHAVLPGMIKRRRGTIINVSSLGAFIPGLTRSLYLGTKSFVHYFTEALSAEISPFGIRVQSLCPGMTVSDFHRNICYNEMEKSKRQLPFMTPEEVVSSSLRSLEKGCTLCIPGAINKLFYIVAKLLPTPGIDANLWIPEEKTSYGIRRFTRHETAEDRQNLPHVEACLLKHLDYLINRINSKRTVHSKTFPSLLLSPPVSVLFQGVPLSMPGMVLWACVFCGVSMHW